MTAREAAITHLGAVVDFNGVFGPAPTTPVTASNITCAGPGKWEPYLQAQVASPAVHWQVGENSAPETVVVDTTYTLTCTVTLTNTWSSPVSYMPAMLTEGQIHYLSAPGSNPQTVSSNLAEAGPVDPLGNVTYSTTTPANAFIDKRFQRSVIFDGENRAMDIVPPAVTLSAPASAAEGTPVTILASAVDQSAVTYTWSIVSGGGTLTPNGASAIYLKRQPSSSTIRVKVTDAFGNATTKQVSVQITNVAPTVNVPGGGTVTAGQTASASASFSDPGNDGPWTASVNYGDGSPSEVLAIAMYPDNRSGVFTLSHTFAAAGDPVVIVTVTDIFGAVGTASIPLHVVPNTTVANPTPVQVSPTTTVAFDAVTADGVTSSEPIAPSSAPALPGAFVSSLFAYEVATTATVSGPITVCFTVPAAIDETQFSHLRVLHGENGVLVDRTVLAPDPQAPHFATKTLCARTSSLSPFVIAEIDSVAPALTVNDVTVTSTDASGVIVDYAATATDDHSTPSVVCSPTSGSLFAIGATTVNCTATDDAHNSSTASFIVTVLDGVAPSVSLPALPPVEATSPAGAVITFSVTTVDNVGVQSVTCTPASGSVFPIGTTTITCTVTDTNGNTATASAIATVTLPPSKLATFVAFSQDGTWLRNNVKVVSGSIGANDRRVDRHGEADDDNDRDDATVRIGENSKMLDANSQVVGNVVVLLNKASVYNVTSNVLFSRGLIHGTTTNTVAMPYLSLPSFPTSVPGTVAVDVKKGKTQTLAAGAYGKVHVAQGATLVLTGGLYQMLSLDVDEQATVLFRGPSELRIKTELDTNNKSKLVLDQSVAGLKASQMVIYVEGADQACAHDGRDEDGRDNGAASVHIGEQNVIQANIRALNGTLWIKSKTQATGAFIGRHVRIGQSATLTLDSAWR